MGEGQSFASYQSYNLIYIFMLCIKAASISNDNQGNDKKLSKISNVAESSNGLLNDWIQWMN